MQFIYFIINFPSNIHKSGQYLNYHSIKALKRIGLFFNGRNLATLVKALNFLLVVEQRLDTCLSNFRLLSNEIPRSLTLLLSQTISRQFRPHLLTSLS